MNIYKIIGRIALLSLVLALYSCAEDKYYDLEGYSYGRVAFTAINLNTPEINEAESSSEDYYYYLPDRNSKFSLTAYMLGWYDNDGAIESYDYNISLDKESLIWAGGYNDIEITFRPTEAEEKEATFTMPDGSILTATAESPTIIWHTDSLINKNIVDIFIKAESTFKKSNTEYHNVGYIFLNIDQELRYNKFNDKWYVSPWTYGQPLEEKTYVKFTAENLMIQGDTCTSCNYNFPNTIESRYENFSLPYFVSENEPHLLYDFNLGGNEIFAVGGEKILFTFIPAPGEKSMRLELPTGETVTLTDSEPTYTWDFTLDNALNLYNYTHYINAYSEYTYNGINYYGQSEIKLNTTINIMYNSVSGKYFRYAY